MDPKTILTAAGILLTIGLAAIALAVAWGRLKKTVESHTQSIAGCKMDDLVSDDDCENIRDRCTDRLDLILGNLTEKFEDLKTDVKDDMEEIKIDAKTDRKEHASYREQTAGALGRIEVTLNLLTNGLKK